MGFFRSLSRGQSEATPVRALTIVSVVVASVAAVVVAVGLLLYVLAQ